MGYRELMATPLKTFLLLNRNVSRLRAESDLRSLHVTAQAQSSESATEFQSRLINEMNGAEDPAEVKPDLNTPLDRDGLNDLRRMQ
jgi:hypothetical protein